MIPLANKKDLKPEDFPSDIEGLRMTRQRREVLAVILRDRDHPTANDVFRRAQDRMPTISLATVYNCLEALVSHNIVRQVNLDRESSRYCPNLSDHCHFQDESSGKIHDVVFKEGVKLEDILELPKGTEISHLDISLKGNFGNK
ncbi:transcriptional repressor [bacterium]|jgi:Fur family peroxide stress response transcriptional regulator|nr:transcriptional repressor [Verrucomicrobiota bacterium]MDA7676109.1 transcriptional repressor [Akkermansiaceae bacterium]MDB4371586.1 transcriptional repressor [bacterium]MBT6399187.1 transcriptional repressor [Verrucomicrobiota bacterium]MDA7883217.1 transcriptional repressor [Akkermansiaceae bacterium]|tara:strand:+ start:302 stop:733 length:432 start_codon:yes stop_codon:yes gene_type:complete